MLDLNRSTAMMLRIGIYVGLAVIIAGLAMSMLGLGDTVLYMGMLILIISPFLGIVVSLAALIREGDRKWAGVAAVLLIITVIGVIISL